MMREQIKLFLGVLAKQRKVIMSFVMPVHMSVRPSVRMKKFCPHWTAFYEN
jgi:hypothetical protein